MDVMTDGLRYLERPPDAADMSGLQHRHGELPHGDIQTEQFAAVQTLQQRREELQRQLGEADLDVEPVRTRWSNHLAEDAQDHQERQQVAALRTIVRDELLRVEHALERAARDLYGICEDCGRQIPLRRLRVVPTATLCVVCQQGREAVVGRQ